MQLRPRFAVELVDIANAMVCATPQELSPCVVQSLQSFVAELMHQRSDYFPVVSDSDRAQSAPFCYCFLPSSLRMGVEMSGGLLLCPSHCPSHWRMDSFLKHMLDLQCYAGCSWLLTPKHILVTLAFFADFIVEVSATSSFPSAILSY